MLLFTVVVFGLLRTVPSIKLISYAHEGDACNRQNTRWQAIPDSLHDFLYCHERHGVYVRDQCASVNGRKKVFDERAQQCIFRQNPPIPSGNFLNSTYHRVGDACATDNDCLPSAFCNSSGSCVCQKAYVPQSGQCWPKIGIEKVDCSFDAQCSASWPNARCLQHVCKCPENTVPVEMSHGVACALRDECPLGGKSVILSKSENCRNKGGCFLEGKDLNPFYNCIDGEGFKTSICCPNRGKTIMQPAMPGNGALRLKRYFYNPMTEECEEFLFKNGKLANSNIFETREHCATFIFNGCPRGSAQHKLVKSCLSNSDCGSKYSCFKRGNQKTGMCCASPAWICSASGGLEPDATNGNGTDFNVGMTPSHISAVFFPVIRYYYSEKDHKCKAFLYRGEAGNFNNFLTMEHCLTFCSSVICKGRSVKLTQSGEIAKCSKSKKCLFGDECIGGLCCSASNEQPLKCPAGSDPLNEPSGVGHVLCTLNNPCPPAFVCELAFSDPHEANSSRKLVQRNGICCRNRFLSTTLSPYTTVSSATTTLRPTVITAVCPHGRNRTILQESGSGKPVTCQLVKVLSRNVCSGMENYICSFKDVNATEGVCCTRPKPQEFRCPAGMHPVAEEGKSVSQCSPFLLDSCPHSSLCVFDELYGTYHCCDSKESGCPSGQAPLKDPPTGATFQCNSQFTPPCPPGFACHYSQLYNRYQCCGVSQGCRSNSAAYLSPIHGKPLKCSNKVSCPSGFHCSYSAVGTSGTGTCCSKDPLLSLCDHGEALEMLNGMAKTCTRSCPFGFECVSKRNISVCCPTPGHVCRLPVDNGEWCKNGVRKTQFYFDALTQSCKSFVFYGCGGNSNRFQVAAACDQFCHTAAVCQHGLPYQTSQGVYSCSESSNCPKGFTCIETKAGHYCCPSPEQVCTLSKVEGFRCKSGSVQQLWFFDVGAAACSKMQSFGCGGNFNRFLNREKCEDFCFSGLCPHGSPLASRHQLRTCSAFSSCDTGYECSKARYGELPHSLCCPTPDMVCRQPEQIGFPCGIAQYRYSFNAEKQVCQRFQYMGCQGSENNFHSRKKCEEFCTADFDVCPEGSKPYIDSRSGRSLTCSPLYHSCPSDYSCTPRTPTKYYCCTKPPKCRNGAFPFIERNQVVPKKCSPGHFGFFDGCPNGYMCQIATDGSNRCCSNPSRLNQYCPVGWQPFVAPGAKRAMTCSDRRSGGGCLAGYECLFSDTYKEKFCCSRVFRQHSEAISEQPVADDNGTRLKPLDKSTECLDGSSPYVDRFTGSVRICSPYLKFSCPENYRCEYNAPIARYQCCKSGLPNKIRPANSACPAGLLPFLEPLSRQPIVCQPGVPGFCPFTSMCQYSPAYWQFICCTSAEDPNSPLMSQHRRSANLYDSRPEKVGNFEQLSWLQKIYPGEPGCEIDVQCSSAFPKAYCQDWICLCPTGMFIFERSCIFECPRGYVPSGGRCIMHRYDLTIPRRKLH